MTPSIIVRQHDQGTGIPYFPFRMKIVLTGRTETILFYGKILFIINNSHLQSSLIEALTLPVTFTLPVTCHKNSAVSVFFEHQIHMGNGW